MTGRVVDQPEIRKNFPQISQMLAEKRSAEISEICGKLKNFNNTKR
jgi:hypothetical protein